MAEVDDSEQVLVQLAQSLHRHRLSGVAQLFLRSGHVASIVLSQLCLFGQTFVPSPLRQRLASYANALETEASWQRLIEHLNALES
ncbi:MAG TPA: hypothetical protein DEF47_07315 [Herpetosiphon sp.]|uniref:Uncharacterized protein n=1 Tax=Herpetosiphon aurantiacus (strain ATCC 23779 / DSM 785 / 114-95) TaxID=316274 RepID=A9B6D6_HERA2|nr:hypothetical protein [Herpetosiphon sp.]ABX02839.1 hypothetical protein Haur_0187 [Herpetosiphon aurantiacus DSM 785]HBW49698.1 hypothetical protein [Herpetosiphon sp.]